MLTLCGMALRLLLWGAATVHWLGFFRAAFIGMAAILAFPRRLITWLSELSESGVYTFLTVLLAVEIVVGSLGSDSLSRSVKYPLWLLYPLLYAGVLSAYKHSGFAGFVFCSLWWWLPLLWGCSLPFISCNDLPRALDMLLAGVLLACLRENTSAPREKS